MTPIVKVSSSPITPGAALSEFTHSATDAGAIVSFSGLVRPQSQQGDVEILHLQAHPTLTVNGIEQATRDATKRWPLQALTILHRTGDMTPRDTIVFVAAAATHRRAAFEAVDFMMDYLKTQAVFWKKETGAGTSQWIEPRANDYSDYSRWEQNKEA